jgi:MFS family permease
VTSATGSSSASPFRPFQHRAWATIWAGSFVSNIGTWMETVAIGVYVTQTTGQATWTGVVAALTYVPTVVLGPIGGALADRFDRRRYLTAVVLFQVCLAGTLTLLAVTGRLSVPAVATIVLLAGCAFALSMPAAAAMTPDLVPPEDLLGATSLSTAQFNLGRVIGPALAGLVITAGGLGWAFGLNTVSFGAVLASLALIRVPPLQRAPGSRPGLWATFVDGVQAARADTGIRTALLLLLATTFLVSPFIGLVPAVAIKVFDAGATGTSTLVTAQGIGAVLSALVAGPLSARLGRRRLLVGSVLLVGPAAVLYGLAPTFVVATAAIGVLGFVYLWVLSGTGTVCQARAPRELRARIASLFMLAVGGGHSLGLVVQGWLGDRLGLPRVTAVTGLALLGIVVATWALRPEWLRSMDDPAVAPPASTDDPAVAPPASTDPAAAPPAWTDAAAMESAEGLAAGLGSAEVHALQPADGQHERQQGDHRGE